MGDMDRLGEYSQYGHRLIGQRAAEVADVIITEGTEASLAGRAALDRGVDRSRICTTYSVQDTVAALKEQYAVTANDVVLITGGQSARMEMVVQALLQNELDRARLPRQTFGLETTTLVQPARPSWVEVELDALATNVRTIKNLVGHQVALMAVVKADAYGHGAVAVSRTALLNGAEYLAVGAMHEALELREAGIDAPILVLNYAPLSAVRQAIRQNITLTLYNLDLARQYDRITRELGDRLHVHVKVDTGMGRLGVLASDALTLFRHLVNLSSLEIEGIYTHFASADEDPDFTAHQVRVFKDVLKPLRASGFSFAYIHAANSAGTLASKDNHFNMVRVGLAMYGLAPSPAIILPAEIQPVLSWKTVIAQVKTLPAGHGVGYGGTYHTTGEERIAVIPVGYADGFRRAPNNWGEVLVHGQRAPLVGRVSMEKASINVTHIPNVTIGDEVVLIGRQGDGLITTDEVAGRLGTNNYEVLTGILPRTARR
jgi:alanine racemase